MVGSSLTQVRLYNSMVPSTEVRMAAGTSLLKTNAAKLLNVEKNVFSWTDEEVQAFIELRIENNEYFTGKRGSAKIGWLRVAELLEKRLGKKTPDSKQCKKKWENLLYRYKILISTANNMCDEGSPQIQAINWPYFDVLHDFLSSRHSMSSSLMLDASRLLESPISLTYRATSEPPERKPLRHPSNYVSIISETEQDADEHITSPEASMTEETSERLSRAKLELTLLTIEQQKRHEERMKRLFQVRLEKEEIERDILRLQLKKMRTDLGEEER